MKYLLDTCIVSELIKPQPNSSVTSWIDSTDEESLFLCVLTIGEIQKGISKLKDVSRQDTLQHWLDNELQNRFSGRILPISSDVASSWGYLCALAEKKGSPIPTVDGLLCATALVNNLTLVTRNVKDVKETNVIILNPWDLNTRS